MAKSTKKSKQIQVPKYDLQQLGIIITRPANQSQLLMQNIKHNNGRYFVAPCLEIADPTNIKTANDICTNQAKNYDYWLFTSPNSITYGLKHGLVFEDKLCIAIGLGTKIELEKVTNAPIIHADKPYTSEALLEALKKEDLANKKILIISGEGGRRILGDALNELGAIADYVNVYRRIKPTKIDLTPAIDYAKNYNLAILISSQEALDHYHFAAKDQDPNPLARTLIVASERLKTYALTLGYKAIIVAESAYPEDIWKALSGNINNLLKSDQTLIIETEILLQSTDDKARNEGKSMSQKNKKEQNNQNDNVKNTLKKENVKEKEKEKAEEVIKTAEEPIILKEPKEPKKVDKPIIEPPLLENSATSPQKSGGNGLSMLALVAGLAGIGLAGFNYLNPAETKAPPTINIDEYTNAMATLKSKVEQLENAPAPAVAVAFDPTALENRIAELAKIPEKIVPELQSANGELRSQFDRVNTKQTEMISRLAEQDNLITNVGTIAKNTENLTHSLETKFTENLIAQKNALNDVNELTSRIKNSTDLNALSLAEVHYLLKIATYKLRFEKDTASSIESLTLANERLDEIGEARFAETKNRIQENLLTLAKIHSVDREAVAKKVLSIAALIQNAPLKANEATNLLKQTFTADANAKDKGDRWYDNVANNLKPLFIIKRERIEAPELMAVEDAHYLALNMQLQLSAARSAILQNLPETYQQSLKDARDWLTTYYSANDDNVALAIAEIDALVDLNFATELPDLTPVLKAFEATMKVRQGAGL